MQNGSIDHHKRILAIGGGKGGIGKSVIASNLALSLARHGKKVVIVNLDLGSSNIGTILGLKSTKANIDHFINTSNCNINDVIVNTPYENLGVIQGSIGQFKLTNLKFTHKQKIINNLRSIDADYIVIDLGGGFYLNTLDFFNSADDKILVFTPEPTSVKDVYSFIKCAIYRNLTRTFCNKSDVNFIIESATSLNGDGIAKKMTELISDIYEVDRDLCNIAINMLNRYRPKLILNMVGEESDLNYANKIKDVCKKFLNIEAEFTGFISADRDVKMSVRKMKPLVITHPFCEAAQHINSICNKIIAEEQSETKIFSKVKEINGLDKYFFDMNTKTHYDIIKKIPIYSHTITDVKCLDCGEEHFYLPYQYNAGLISCKACGYNMHLKDIFYTLNDRNKTILLNNKLMQGILELDAIEVS